MRHVSNSLSDIILHGLVDRIFSLFTIASFCNCQHFFKDSDVLFHCYLIKFFFYISMYVIYW